MSKDEKVIEVKIGLLEVARQIGNASMACRVAQEGWILTEG